MSIVLWLQYQGTESASGHCGHWWEGGLLWGAGRSRSDNLFIARSHGRPESQQLGQEPRVP